MSGNVRVIRHHHETLNLQKTMTANAANTIRLHRVLRAPAERIYRAFLDADAMAKWLPPFGFTCKVHQLDAKVGGSYRMSFTNFTTGKGHSFGGTYLDLKPGELLRYTNKFEDANLSNEMQTTITLRPVFCGTEMNVTQEAESPAAIPVEACYMGWQESLTLLAQLVEAEIPDPTCRVDPGSPRISSCRWKSCSESSPILRLRQRPRCQPQCR